MRQTQLILQEAFNAHYQEQQVDESDFPKISQIVAAPAHPAASKQITGSSKTTNSTISNKYTLIEGLLMKRPGENVHFADFTDEELKQNNLLDDLANSSKNSSKSSNNLNLITFKQVMQEFDRRMQLKQQEEEDFLNLLQMGSNPEEESEEIQEESISEVEKVDKNL